jgi:hypothetical protein
LGILCEPKQAALKKFPTEYHSDWQWWDIIKNAAVMELDNLPVELRPIVQVVPDWFDPKRLGLLFEAKLNGGKLLVCSADLEKNIHSRPVASQLRRSILAYMESDKFRPSVEVTAEQIQGIFKKPSLMKLLGATVTADSAAPDCEAVKAIDGNPETLWHTPWSGSAPAYPHQLTVDLKKNMKLKGITLLQRQGGNRNGLVKDVAVSLSDDAQNWGDPIVSVSLKKIRTPQTILFPEVASARYIRIDILSGQKKSSPLASFAELEIIPAE